MERNGHNLYKHFVTNYYQHKMNVNNKVCIGDSICIHITWKFAVTAALYSDVHNITPLALYLLTL